LVGASFARRVIDNDSGTFRRIQLGDSCADTFGSAGNNGNLVGELIGHDAFPP
jgi:hypothetical protein